MKDGQTPEENSGNPGGSAAELREATRELRVGGIPSEWVEMIEVRAEQLTISVSALIRMILGDWYRRERRP